eukprot:jgi/Tetstr1/449888/TSEL_036947.t1
MATKGVQGCQVLAGDHRCCLHAGVGLLRELRQDESIHDSLCAISLGKEDEEFANTLRVAVALTSHVALLRAIHLRTIVIYLTESEFDPSGLIIHLFSQTIREAGEMGGNTDSHNQIRRAAIGLRKKARKTSPPPPGAHISREKQKGGKGKGKRGQGGAGSKRGRREEEGGAQDRQLYYGVGTAEVVPGAAEPETLVMYAKVPAIDKAGLDKGDASRQEACPSDAPPRSAAPESQPASTGAPHVAKIPSAKAGPTDEPPRGAAPNPHAKRSRRVAALAIGPSWADTQSVAGQGQGPPAADMSPSLAAAAGDAAEGLPTPSDSHAGESGGQGAGASAATLSGLALALGGGEGVPDANGSEAKGATTTMPIPASNEATQVAKVDGLAVM